MAHPFNNVRANKVEHNRVSHITRGYAAGGTVHSDEKEDRKLIKKMMVAEEKKEAKTEGKKRGGAVNAERDAQAVLGKPARQRLDRPNRARGGRTKHKSGKTNVNVIVAPQQHPGMAALPTPGASPVAPPRPPIPAPPVGVGGPPMAGPPGLPPGMPPRPMIPPPGAAPGMMPHRYGGRAYAKGGKVGPAFKEGRKNGTQVSHTNNKGDGKNVGRGKVVTYKTGGAVNAPKGDAGMGPDLHGGGGGGKGRLAKERRAERDYAKPQGAHG